MKTKFKVLFSALTAAALSAGTVAAAAVPGHITADERELARESAMMIRNTDEWRTAFEDALLEGRSPVDPVHDAAPIYPADEDFIGGEDVMPAYINASAASPTPVQLTLVHDEDGYGYNLWSGRFIVDSVTGFAATFTEPETMECVLNIGTKAELVYKRGFSVLHKMLSGRFTYLEGSKRVTTPAVTVSGTGTLAPISSSYTGSGKLIEKAYYFYVYRGDVNAPYWDVVVIHVVDKDYADTDEYAALPYGNLINSYTYVDTENMGVLPSTEK